MMHQEIEKFVYVLILVACPTLPHPGFFKAESHPTQEVQCLSSTVLCLAWAAGADDEGAGCRKGFELYH